MITIVVLYLLIYLLIFAFMQTLVDADVSVSFSRAACSSTTHSPMQKFTQYIKSVQLNHSNATFAAVSIMIVALLCGVVQLLCLCLTLFVVKFVLALVGTVMSLFKDDFSNERLFSMPGVLGVVHEVIYINVDGTARGQFMADFRRACMTDMNHVIRFGLVQAAFGWFLQHCLGYLKTPSTATDATVVRYTGLVFGIVNFVFMFTGAACGIKDIKCGAEPSAAAAVPATQPDAPAGGEPVGEVPPAEGLAASGEPAAATGETAGDAVVSGPVPVKPAEVPAAAAATPKRPGFFSRMAGAANKFGQKIGDGINKETDRYKKELQKRLPNNPAPAPKAAQAPAQPAAPTAVAAPPPT